MPFSFLPLWKSLAAGEIDAFQAYAMCPAWVTPERFRRQHANFLGRMARNRNHARECALTKREHDEIVECYHDRWGLLV
jgi:hypothetical protein